MTANATGTRVPTSAKRSRNLAVRRCMLCLCESEPQGGASIEQNRERAQAEG